MASGAMPERFIPWMQVASDLGGKAEVDTGLASSWYRMVATVDGLAVDVTGHSVPYAAFSSQTTVRAECLAVGGFRLRVARDRAALPFISRLYGRDLEIGDRRFDARYIVRSSDQGVAQAWLGPKVRAAIERVRDVPVVGPYGDSILPWMHYQFSVRRGAATARRAGFETDPDRLLAAIRAAVALARRPDELLPEWRGLARALDGRLEHGDRWRTDGSTRIQLPFQGRLLSLSPVQVRVGWRTRRLRTRISCERTGEATDRFAIVRHGTDPPQRAGEPVALSDTSRERLSGYHICGQSPGRVRERITPALAEAIASAAPVVVAATERMLMLDLDGYVTDPDRLLAGAAALAGMAGDRHAAASVYR